LGLLVWKFDQLVAVLTRIDEEAYSTKGKWFLETGFGLLSGQHKSLDTSRYTFPDPMCRLESAKSITVCPFGPVMLAERMFHSFGTVQFRRGIHTPEDQNSLAVFTNSRAKKLTVDQRTNRAKSH
jgi:hypothetical protein